MARKYEVLLKKAESHRVFPVAGMDNEYTVASFKSMTMYTVTLRGRIARCQCECFRHKGVCCTHLIAAARLRASEKGYQVIGVWPSKRTLKERFPQAKYFRVLDVVLGAKEI